MAPSIIIRQVVNCLPVPGSRRLVPCLVDYYANINRSIGRTKKWKRSSRWTSAHLRDCKIVIIRAVSPFPHPPYTLTKTRLQRASEEKKIKNPQSFHERRDENISTKLFLATCCHKQLIFSYIRHLSQQWRVVGGMLNVPPSYVSLDFIYILRRLVVRTQRHHRVLSRTPTIHPV